MCCSAAYSRLRPICRRRCSPAVTPHWPWSELTRTLSTLASPCGRFVLSPPWLLSWWQELLFTATGSSVAAKPGIQSIAIACCQQSVLDCLVIQKYCFNLYRCYREPLSLRGARMLDDDYRPVEMLPMPAASSSHSQPSRAHCLTNWLSLTFAYFIFSPLLVLIIVLTIFKQ